MKKRYFITILVFFLFSLKIYAQCSSSPIFTNLGIPGVYPPELPIPNIPFVGISDGTIGVNYSETLTVINLSDTSLDIASFLPTPVLTAVNLAGISTVMSLNVNSVSYNVSGLPSGMIYNCDQLNCVYVSGINDGCIKLEGIPTQSGNFSLPVKMTVNIQIPAITDPILGTILFAGMSQDLPEISAVEYDLQISNNTNVIDNNINEDYIYYNENGLPVLNFKSVTGIKVFSLDGKVIYEKFSVNASLEIDNKVFRRGIYFIKIFNNSQIQTKKLIIK